MSDIENAYQEKKPLMTLRTLKVKDTGLVELFKYKELLWHLIGSELKTENRDKILGNLWAILDPLAVMLVYMFVVGVVFRAKEPNFPVFLYTGIVAWYFFNGSVRGAANLLSSNASLIRLSYFPKALIPLAHVISKLFDFAFGWIALSLLYIFFHIQPTSKLLWFPLLVTVQFMFNLGCAYYIAYLGVYFKDVANILRFTIRFLWFFSPVLYSLKRVPSKYLDLYMLNPMATFIVSYRNVMLYGQNPPLNFFLITAILSVVLLVSGYFVFKRKEGEYAKYL